MTTTSDPRGKTRAKKPASAISTDPLWYKDAVIYQLHIRSFFDSDADGIGDFRGLTQKLDYLQDLGVTAIWLLPFYPSPLRDDGYDISDYTAVNPRYGTLRDFSEFLRQAHARGLRVITEMVLNHTSDQHPWFQRARRARPGSRYRDFYVWSDTPEKYREARIIFKDFETSNWAWDPVAKAYYWHRFYSHQPDLNYDNPEVRRAMFRRLDFWLRRGVDGVRLDAVPYLYEREGTNCENLPETHAYLKELRRHIDEHFPGRMLLAEANQWPEEAINYLGDGDECHMAFHFPLMPRLFMAIRMENRFPIIDILEQTPPVPDTAQWAIFLRNHDELTLEMVTDEERDYMYRVYAHDPGMRINLGIRRRLSPLLENDRNRIELMNSLLFSLPGTPIVYYGDEIGMGDNYYLGDRNAVRTPMQWSSDRNAGFSRATPQRLLLPVIIDPEYHFEAVNVEAQQGNPHSLLWWTRRLIALRKRFRAFSRGSLEFLHPKNFKVLAFVRSWENERILVVANLSRFVQPVELDLKGFRGLAPVELFGGSRLPPVQESPYFLTLAPHSFCWFSFEPVETEEVELREGPDRLPTITVSASWRDVFRDRTRPELERILPAYLRRRRWFGAKARRILDVKIADTVPIGPSPEKPRAVLVLLRVEYVDGEPESYLLPLAGGESGPDPQPSAVAELRSRNGDEAGVLFDALWDPEFCSFLLEAVRKRKRFRGERGEIATQPSRLLRQAEVDDDEMKPSVMGAEQSNTSVRFGTQFILKVFRRLHEGSNPDVEIGKFLTEARFEHTARSLGSLTYSRSKETPLQIGILQGFVPNQGDAWTYALEALGRYFERVLARTAEPESEPLRPEPSRLLAARTELPEAVPELLGTAMESLLLLGRRTAELHVTLASATDDPAFVPEPFSPFDQRSLYQSMRNAARRSFDLLRQRLDRLPAGGRERAAEILAREGEVMAYYRRVVDRKIDAVRIRCHGDYHLGQVLYTGKDFVIIDFEGEPARSLAERRLKRSPLVDVAGMLRSFHYAASNALRSQSESGVVAEEQRPIVERWARFWHEWIGTVFLKGYLDEAADAPFLPEEDDVFEYLLNAFLLEKAVYELGYELNNRPDWVGIPLRGIASCLDATEREDGGEAPR